MLQGLSGESYRLIESQSGISKRGYNQPVGLLAVSLICAQNLTFAMEFLAG